MVPPSSHGVSRVPRYFGYSSLILSFAYVTLTLFGTFSHTFQLEIINTKCCPKPHKYCYLWFSLFRFRSPLLTESRLISLPRPTQMFQFRRFPSISYEFTYGCMDYLHADCSIRTSTDQCLLTTPRSFSQLTTSFIGSQCQGIHSTLFYALPFVSWSLSRSLMIFLLLQFFTRLDFSCRFFTYSQFPHFHLVFFLFCFQAAFCSLLSFKNRYQKINLNLSSDIHS